MKGINGQNILNSTWEEALLEAMEKTQSVFIRFIVNGSLVKQILIGLVAGIILALVSTPAAIAVGLLGSLFVGALKAVAPVLVLMLVMASIANHKKGQNQYSPYSVPVCIRDILSGTGCGCRQLYPPINPYFGG